MTAAVKLHLVALVAVGALVWLFFAFSAAATARNNGRSYHLWLLFGLVTGPVGAVVSYFYFRRWGERARRHRYGAGGSELPEMIKCPRCGQLLPRSFDTCQFCGEPLKGRRR